MSRGAGRARRADVVALLAIAGLAVFYTVGVVWPRAQAAGGIPHFDTYTYFYPNWAYALRSLQDGGSGLLWNRFQNCGQPFYAMSLTGLLYPPFAVMGVLDLSRALLVLVALHLAIAAGGMYALGRALGLSAAAALCGAVAFELGTNTLWMGYWSPSAIAVYAWLPVALAACERLLRRPSARDGGRLTVALGLQLLVGYPQVSLFTYQLLALRVLWECVTRWRPAVPRALVVMGVAALLAPLLCAVHLVPALEAAAVSIRQRPLTVEEMRIPLLTLTWTQFRHAVGERSSYGALFSVGTLVLMGLAWLPHATRRVALFYALVTGLYFALAFETPIFFDLYRVLPFGSSLREPHRFLWVAACAGCVVTAIGAEAILRPQPGARRRSLALFVVPVALAIAFGFLSPTGIAAREVGLVALVLALVGATLHPRGRGLVRVGLPAVLAVELLAQSSRQVFGYLRDDTMLMQHRDAFLAVRDRQTPQDRMYLIPGTASVRWQGLPDGLFRKAAQLFRVPSIVDYEPETSDRYAQMLVYMMEGRPMTTINQFLYELRVVPASQRLFDLVAARFVVIDAARAAQLGWPSGPDFPVRWQHDGQRVYENLRALPRALYVPQARVVADPAAVLDALASGTEDPRRTALIEGTPAALLGTPGGTGSAHVVDDVSESVRIRVTATTAGFLVLADQDYPGWEATVNGTPAPIRRANFAFRLVAVPAGTSDVEFRYRPQSLVWGALVSSATAAALAAAMWRRQRRLRKTA